MDDLQLMWTFSLKKFLMHTNYFSFPKIFKIFSWQNDEKFSFERSVPPSSPTGPARSSFYPFCLCLPLAICFFASHPAAHMVINEALNRA